MKTKFEIRGFDGPWLFGTFATGGSEYKFIAKVFDNPSQFGIEGGRVSKLHVTLNKDVVFNYDRGMDIDHAVGHKINKLICNAF